MNLKPMFDKIIIRRESLKEKASAIYIPEDVDKKERPARGVVVALGPTVGYLDDETGKIIRNIEIGSKVIFGRYAGTEITYENDSYWIVSDRDILCEIAE